MPTLFADPRWTRASVALLVALGLSFALTLTSGSGAKTAAGRLGGDYPSFYAAGRIARAGDLDEVQNGDRLEKEQADLGVAGDDGGYIAFPYPAHVAVAYEPLAALPYRASYVVHTLLMLAAFVAALWLLRPVIPLIDEHFLVATAIAVGFFPMFRALGGGQNTALALLLLVGAWRAARADREVLAGVLLGLQLFKPQVAAPLALVFLLEKRWKLLATFAVMGAATWAVNAALVGTDWLSTWLTNVSDYSELEAHFNATNTISFPGVADTLFDYGTTLSRVVGLGLAAAAVGALVAVWRRYRDRAPDVVLGAALVVTVLASLHAVYYDAGLALVALFVLLERGDRRLRIAAAAMWVLGASHVVADALGFDPYVLVLAAALAALAALTPARTPEVAAETAP